jgi:hypothetical protein
MGQVTIYLDNETERKLNAIIGNSKVSKSKYISELIRAKTSTSWPENVAQLAGAWKDMPEADTIRESMGQDILRESL